MISRISERAPRLALVLSLGVVLAFVLFITIPFAGQALHIDDAVFWDFAKVNLVSPLRQDLPDFQLMGEDIANWRDTHPPLDQLYMSLIMRVTGSDAETPLHLGFILFPAMAGISMFFLARRFTRNALLATLLLLATPALMAESHTLMGDVPMTSLWLAATATYIYGVDRDDWRLLALSGLAGVLAVYAGYQSMALILLLPAYAWLRGRLTWKTALPAAGPALGYGAYALLSLVEYSALPRFTHAHGLSLQGSSLAMRLEGNLLQIGGASVFPLVLIVGFCLRRRRWLLLAPILAAAIALAWYYSRNTNIFPPNTAALYILFFTAGALMVVAVSSEAGVQLQNALNNRKVDTDAIYLAFWLLSMLTLVAFLLPHATAKYTLPWLAPMVLLLFRELEGAIKSAATVTFIGVAAVALTFTTGTAVSSSDNQLAQVYKDYALEFENRYEPAGTVWFVGEWGFRHYMEAQGYNYLTTASREPKEGDLVVRTSLMEWPLDPSVSSRLQLLDSSEPTSGSLLRVMDPADNAGFYGTYWGKLPYTISDRPVERFDVYQVGPAQGR